MRAVGILGCEQLVEPELGLLERRFDPVAERREPRRADRDEQRLDRDLAAREVGEAALDELLTGLHGATLAVMASKKQRRREEKLRRHEYEWVLPTEEGEQVVNPRELRAEKEAARPAPAKGATAARPAARGRAGRPVQPPSWKRAAKRMGWIGPVFFVFLEFTGGKNKPPIGVSLGWALALTVLFIPITYYIDRFAYRSYVKRRGDAPPQRPPARGSG